MKVTYLGTTMLLFDDGRDQLLFDCHVTRPSLVTCLTGKLVTNKEIADRVMRTFPMDRLRGIFISHSHHDHVLDAPYFAQRCQAALYGSPSALNVGRGGNVPEEKLYSYADSLEYQIGDFYIKVLPSVHSKPHWFNNDLGQMIAQPLVQPAGKKEFKEGGSFDFLITHLGKKYLIRPSYNYLEGQLQDIHADVRFLGITGLSKDTKERRKCFFEETIAQVKPKIVVPIHWDNFFSPLFREVKKLPSMVENTEKSLYLLGEYCAGQGIDYVVQMPLSSMEYA